MFTLSHLRAHTRAQCNADWSPTVTIVDREMWPKRALAVLLALSQLEAARAATLPADFIETTLAEGLRYPMRVSIAPDGRVFIITQPGQIRLVKDDALLASPVLSIPNVLFMGEGGGMDVMVDAQRLYVYYTSAGIPFVRGIHNQISYWPLRGDYYVSPYEERVLFELNDFTDYLGPVHNGGAMALGADGLLYFTVGDNEKPMYATRANELLGKVGRITKEGALVPNTNPSFAANTANNRAAWATGFRNPFSITLDTDSGALIVADVGDELMEEIDVLSAESVSAPLPAGTYGQDHFGWPYFEGTTNATAAGPPLVDPNFRPVWPAYAYPHMDEAPPPTDGSPAPDPDCCIIGGGYLPAGSGAFPPQFRGRYFFSDWCR